MEYLQKNNMIVVAPGCNFVKPTETSEITTMRSQCKNIIVEYSWKMIFAEDEAQFEKFYTDMVTKVTSLGFDKVLAEDLKNAAKQDEERKKAVEKYGSQ